MLFAIPLTSLLAYFIPQSGLWVHGGEILVVDFLAVILRSLSGVFINKPKIAENLLQRAVYGLANNHKSTWLK